VGIMLAAGSEIVAVKLVVRNMTVPGTVMFSDLCLWHRS